MMDWNLPVLMLIFVSFLTWLVFVITAAKIYRFFSEFEKFKSTNDVELNSMVWHVKKIQGEISEVILEIKRSNKLLYEIRGAGEFPDHVNEFHHDSDVFRQEKVSAQKVQEKREKPEIDDVQLQAQPVDQALGKLSASFMNKVGKLKVQDDNEE
jgi:biopolymer transport protein ExbB/TolQ